MCLAVWLPGPVRPHSSTNTHTPAHTSHLPRYLVEQVFNKTPLIVTDYPKDIKAFYMKLNPDGKTVAAMDMLVPKVGPGGWRLVGPGPGPGLGLGLGSRRAVLGLPRCLHAPHAAAHAPAPSLPARLPTAAARRLCACSSPAAQVGELIGGSQREDNLQVLEERMKASGLNPEDYWWWAAALGRAAAAGGLRVRCGCH